LRETASQPAAVGPTRDPRLEASIEASLEASLELPLEESWGLPFYLFVEPLGVGKVVVDLSPSAGPGAELLRKAGAIEVFSPGKAGLPLPFPSGGADVVLFGLPESAVVDDVQRAALMAEIRRVLRPEALCVVRVVAAALEKAAVEVPLRAALTDLLLEHFGTVDIVEETPFRGVSFFSPGSDELAVSEAVAKLAGKPSHLIAFCSPSGERTWHLSESLLVPTGSADNPGTGEGELAAWRREVERLTTQVAAISGQRDLLRERQMTLQDGSERVSKTVSALRKDVERYLRQISDDSAARELLALERDQLRRKWTAAEAEREELNREIEKLRSSTQALRKEVARLRAARGTVAGPDPQPK
jgi:SAM-dependent methyltransferase